MCEILMQAPVSKENRVWMTCLEKNMPGRLINSRTSLKSHNLVSKTHTSNLTWESLSFQKTKLKKNLNCNSLHSINFQGITPAAFNLNHDNFLAKAAPWRFHSPAFCQTDCRAIFSLLSLMHGQIRPVLIMAENKPPL